MLRSSSFTFRHIYYHLTAGKSTLWCLPCKLGAYCTLRYYSRAEASTNKIQNMAPSRWGTEWMAKDIHRSFIATRNNALFTGANHAFCWFIVLFLTCLVEYSLHYTFQIVKSDRTGHLSDFERVGRIVVYEKEILRQASCCALGRADCGGRCLRKGRAEYVGYRRQGDANKRRRYHLGTHRPFAAQG